MRNRLVADFRMANEDNVGFRPATLFAGKSNFLEITAQKNYVAFARMRLKICSLYGYRAQKGFRPLLYSIVYDRAFVRHTFLDVV